MFEVSLPGGLERGLELLFRFSANGPDELSLFVGSPGRVRSAVLDKQGARFVLREAVPLVEPDDVSGVMISSLDLCLKEGALGGEASYTVTVLLDDIVQDTDHVEVISARPDTHAPEWIMPATLHPLVADRFITTEALAPEASAELVPDVGPSIALEPVLDGGAVVAFSRTTVLPLGLQAALEGTGSDFADHPLAVSAFPLVTPVDPGVQAQDGFESELRVAVLDSILPIETVSGDAALEGSTSVLVPHGTTALFRLERTPGSDRVLLDLAPRLVSRDIPARIFVRAGVVGGTTVTTLAVPLDPSEPNESVQRLELPLFEDGDTVLVSVEAPFIATSLVASADAVVDELRVE